jgi:hypothetical protein
LASNYVFSSMVVIGDLLSTILKHSLAWGTILQDFVPVFKIRQNFTITLHIGFTHSFQEFEKIRKLDLSRKKSFFDGDFDCYLAYSLSLKPNP